MLTHRGMPEGFYLRGCIPITKPRKDILVTEPNVLACQLLTEQQAAKVMACSVAYLRKLRSVGGGPTTVKIGRLVRYSQACLAAFIEAKKQREA
jgi:hypothetical protein